MKNPKVEAAARLKKRAFREQERRFLVEGPQAVGEALEGPGGLHAIYATDPVDPLVVRATHAGVETIIVSQEVMGKITSTVTPQGIVGISGFVDGSLSDVPVEGCITILHEVRDPGNAGTVLRSADAAGCAGVIFSDTSVDAYNPKTVRASAGSVFHLPIVRGIPTVAAIEQLRERGSTILAMDANGGRDLYAVDLSGPVVFVFGNEAHGLPADISAAADSTVRVPHAGKAESLNLAAAASICLFEWARRRREDQAALETIIAAAAHDIRSPLTAMKGFGFALEKRWQDMTEEQRTMMLRGIVHDADRMDTILRQLVDAARVTAGSLEPYREQVDVGQLVLDLAEQQRRDPEHPEVGWVGGETVAFVDPTRLKTTLFAFMESLVWWAHEGPISIAGAVEGGRLSLSAARAGSEIDTVAADALFRPRRPGTGAGSKIGMFVARRVAEAQGGRTWATVDGDVLTFHLELPAATEAATG